MKYKRWFVNREKGMIIGYIDGFVKNISAQEQAALINSYAKSNGLVIDLISSKSNISELADDLKTKNHTLLLANIVCLGNKLKSIKENLRNLAEKGITVICVKENYKFTPSKELNWMLKGMDLSIDIRNHMVSTITKNALEEKKAQGIRLGRGLGSINKKHAWEGKEELIKDRILAGITNAEIAKEIGMCATSFYAFLKNNPEIKKLGRRCKNA